VAAKIGYRRLPGLDPGLEFMQFIVYGRGANGRTQGTLDLIGGHPDLIDPSLAHVDGPDMLALGADLSVCAWLVIDIQDLQRSLKGNAHIGRWYIANDGRGIWYWETYANSWISI
jgi:hypothetical protein